jgi:hypothetical protein
VRSTDFPSLARSASDDQDIELAPGLPGLPERLLRAQAAGRVLFIAGAGISMQPPASLPDFSKLVREVFGRLDLAIAAHLSAAEAGQLPLIKPEQQAMLDHVDAKEYDVALGMLERFTDSDQEKESRVRRAVADILRATTGHAPIHTDLVRLANRGAATTIATTNFDLLLERAGRAIRKPLQRYGIHDIPRPSLRPDFQGVLHLHGALDRDPARHADLVLTDVLPAVPAKDKLDPSRSRGRCDGAGSLRVRSLGS